ncbi:hypothetical protein L293_2677 [Acinetobacter gyllenbergii CIP 110306 = MTCC 11365]|nr:hypothetical protein L293_2677 [Acinetobacter gyllenbergii CIP 110306 = MTCC 11365]
MGATVDLFSIAGFSITNGACVTFNGSVTIAETSFVSLLLALDDGAGSDFCLTIVGSTTSMVLTGLDGICLDSAD